LVLFRQHGYVVLEGVWHPEVLAADVGDALVGVPVCLFGKGFIDTVVEVLVVGEDDMAANVVKLPVRLESGDSERMQLSLTKPSGVTSVEARPPGVSLLSTINHDGPSYRVVRFSFAGMQLWVLYDLVEALRGTETRRAGADDKNVDVAVSGSVFVVLEILLLLLGFVATHISLTIF
jgi:hypothetical protein